MIESLEQRSLLATVNLGPVVPLAEGFGYGSTIAGLGKAMDLTAPDLYTNVLFTNSSTGDPEIYLAPLDGGERFHEARVSLAQ